MQVLCSEKARKYNDMHEICFRKKLLVCNFIMIQKLVVGRFFHFEKDSRFYAVKGVHPLIQIIIATLTITWN